MGGRQRTWVALAVLVLVAVLGLVWMRRPSSPDGGAGSATAVSASASGTRPGGTSAAGAVTGPKPGALPAADAPDENKPAPAWYAEPGVPPRKVAGIVTFHGKPVEGADVRL